VLETLVSFGQMAAGSRAAVGAPDRFTLLAFAGAVLIGGSNVVAVRLFNKDVPPFFGAGVRFAVAAAIFLAIVALRRIPLPSGRALLGAVLYGLLAFAAFYALVYWALVSLPAGVAAVILSSVPLLTFFLALAHGLEPFRWRALTGALIAIAGIVILINGELTLAIPTASLVAAFGAAACAAESGVVIKHFPPSHPVAVNGLAMAIGAVLLIAISAVSGEDWALPDRAFIWGVLVHLVLLGSLGLFALYLFVLKRWTASGSSYQFVLLPIVATLLGAWLAEEPITSTLLLGGPVILFGVYVGALSHGKVAAPATRENEVLAQRCSST